MPGEPFYLIVTDKDNGTFSVEGPTTDDRQWNHAVAGHMLHGKRIIGRGRRSRLAATVFREAGAAR